MRTWATLFASALLLGYAAPVAAYDVSYSPLASPNTLTCPANATLNGTMCYCNAVYNMSGGQCVKIETPTPTEFQIYDDVLMSVTVNETMTCAQLGITAPADKDMCQRYKATSPDQRDKWKSIQRPPTTVTSGVANPWAPAGQQTMFSASQAIAPTKATPPPAPSVATSSSAATSTSTTKPAATSTPVEVAPENEKIGEALKKVLDDRSKGKPTAAAKTADAPQSAPPDSSVVSQDSTTTYTPPPELIELSKRLAAEAAAPPTPVPATSTESAPAQTAQAVKAVEEPKDSPSIFARILGFFRWLF